MSERLLINSLPKSGTHLLAKVAELSGYTEHFSDKDTDQLSAPLFLNYRETQRGLSRARQQVSQSEEAILVGSQTPVAVGPELFKEWLAGLESRQYILGHVAWSPALSNILNELAYHHLFIIRDPRAVLVSLLSFIHDTIGMPQPHFLQADFRLLSTEEQLDLLLEGGYASLAGAKITPFSTVYRNMLSWRSDPRCLVLRFEDLVGPNGGGSELQQQKAFQKIAGHLGQAFDAGQCHEIYSTTARTFRKGSIDSWKDALDEDAIKKLTDYCQPLCEAAGYSLDD